MKIASYLEIRAGDRVTILTAQGQERTGRAQLLLCNPAAGSVVLNMGGAHGTPAVCTPDNFVRASRAEPRHQNAGREEQQGRYLDCGPGAWDDR